MQQLYITKYYSKTFHKFQNTLYIANINCFGMRNDHYRQAKGLWWILILLWHMSIYGDRECLKQHVKTRNFSGVH